MKTKKSSSLSSINSINVDGIIISDKKNIASSFNNFFSNFQLPADCSNIESIDHITNTFRELKLSEKIVPSLDGFSFTRTNVTEVVSLIKLLNVSSNAGSSDISTKVIKSCADELAPTLAKIFNLRC